MTDDGVSSADVQATFCATLVDEWSRLGLTHAMVAPGSRSTPMALALAGDARWSVSVFHDERSAAFAGLGYAISSGRPAVVLCTSGTAATHFHAAVAEADLSGVPSILVTADRPPESQDVGAAQTIRQQGLFGSAVRWFHDPGVPAASVAGSWRSLARRVLGAAAGEPAGPVHLNLPFREPLVGAASALPPADDTTEEWSLVGTRRLDPTRHATLASRLSVAKPLLVVGRGAPVGLIDAAVERGWPVLAESRMRQSATIVSHVDSLLRHAPFADAHVPDLVVRVGDAPASKVLGQWLVKHAVPQIHVSCDGRVFDPDHRVEMRVVTSADDVIDLFVSLPLVSDRQWLDSWSAAEQSARRAVRCGLDDMGIASGVGAVVEFVHTFPESGSLIVSSSMPIRDVEWFAGPLGSRFVVANRGANGIDGVIATAIGVALDRGGPVGVVLGDVATLHDSSSLAALSSRGLDIRLLVIDNDGGGIFHHLPQATSVEPRTFESLYGTPHGTDFVALGRAHGLESAVVSDRAALAAAVGRRGPSMIVVRTDRSGDVKAHRDLHGRVVDALK